MSDVQKETTPRDEIVKRLRGLVQFHLEINRPLEGIAEENLDLSLDRAAALDAAAKGFAEVQWAALGFRTRLVTVPSDPWKMDEDRIERGERYLPFRNGSQYHCAGDAQGALAAIEAQGIDLAQGTYLIPQLLGKDLLKVKSWGSKKNVGSVRDPDVIELRTTYIDVDAKKAIDGMATEEEVWETFEVAADLYCDLVTVLGSETGLGFVFSGSGCQIWIHHEGMTPADGREPRLKLLHSLAQIYARGYALRIDTTVANPARLAPLAGSMKRKPKGPGRPHRMVAYWSFGDPGARIKKGELVRVADHFASIAPVPEAVLRQPATRVASDSDSIFKVANAVPIHEVYALLGRMAGKDPKCPNCDWDNPKSVMFHENCLKDFHSECPTVGQGKTHWTVLDTVMHDLNLDAGHAYDWLASRFGLPEREAYVEFVPGEDEGMVVDTGRIESETDFVPDPVAPRHCVPGRYRLTDLGNAERLVALHGRDIRYVPLWRKWLAWDGKRWVIDDSKRIDQLAQITVRSIYMEAQAEMDPDKRTAIAKHACKSESARAKSGLLEHATSLPGIAVTPAQLDANLWLFNVQNGTLELKTGKIKTQVREDLITKISPVIFDPTATCPTYEGFLRTCLPDDEVRRGLLRLRGYALTGVVREHVFVVQFGGGGNGKGTQQELDLHVWGDYGVKIPSQVLMASRGEQHPTATASLFGKRLALASETDEGKQLNIALVKELTGGDTISTRRMREDFWEFQPTHKLILSTNNKPIVRETKHAAWRRIHAYGWGVTITKPDTSLTARLIAEASGYLNLVLAACLEWQREGLLVPEAVRLQSEAYRDESDVLGRFLSDCCVVGKGKVATSDALYDAYSKWCDADGEKPWSKTAFGRALGERGFEAGKERGVRVRLGLTTTHEDREALLQEEVGGWLAEAQASAMEGPGHLTCPRAANVSSELLNEINPLESVDTLDNEIPLKQPSNLSLEVNRKSTSNPSNVSTPPEHTRYVDVLQVSMEGGEYIHAFQNADGTATGLYLPSPLRPVTLAEGETSDVDWLAVATYRGSEVLGLALAPSGANVVVVG